VKILSPLEKNQHICESEGNVKPPLSGYISMLIYIGFTTVWTLVIVCHAAMARRIHDRIIRPIDRRLAGYGVPGVIQSGITGVLCWSIIPLGFLWIGGLVLTALPYRSRKPKQRISHSAAAMRG
jgi:hypothetical protein